MQVCITIELRRGKSHNNKCYVVGVQKGAAGLMRALAVWHVRLRRIHSVYGRALPLGTGWANYFAKGP
jgi:hypothetical protein